MNEPTSPVEYVPTSTEELARWGCANAKPVKVLSQDSTGRPVLQLASGRIVR